MVSHFFLYILLVVQCVSKYSFVSLHSRNIYNGIDIKHETINIVLFRKRGLCSTYTFSHCGFFFVLKYLLLQNTVFLDCKKKVTDIE
jgi:hypothetical protein